MLVKGYFHNWWIDCEENEFVMDIKADKEQIGNCFNIARCLYNGYDDELDDYDYPMGFDTFSKNVELSGLSSRESYTGYLGFVLDEFEIDWSFYNIPCDLEICVN